MNKTISSLFIVLLLSSCTFPWEYGFVLKNNSSDSIRCELGLNYPDVSLSDVDKYANGGRDFGPNEYASLFRGPTGLPSEHAVIHALNPNDTISVFIINLDTLKSYSWETIRDEYKIMVRYDLSADDIHSMEERDVEAAYVIPFPPSPVMKNMHMYPSYEEVIAKYGN